MLINLKVMVLGDMRPRLLVGKRTVPNASQEQDASVFSSSEFSTRVALADINICLKRNAD